LRQLADSYEENETLKVEIKAVKKEIKTLAPKAEKFDEFQNSDGYYYIGDLAKVLNPKGMGRNLLFGFLRDLRVLVKDFDNRSIPTQRYMKSGYFKVVFREYSFYTKYGTRETRKNATTYVTPKGMDFIRDLLIQHGYLTAKKEVC
jgi:anti-repressor protein